MAETNTPSTESTVSSEEKEWRDRILEELRRLNRNLEKIADRVGGFEGA